MIGLDLDAGLLVGAGGSLAVRPDDEVTYRLAMLIEGECAGLGPLRAARKYGYCKQRYFQLRHLFARQGALALANHKRGPKTQYRRTEAVIRWVIRWRFLDPEMSAAVIAQKLRQMQFRLSTSSVERIIAAYGLQKKTLPPAARRPRHRDPSHQAQGPRGTDNPRQSGAGPASTSGR